MRARRIIRSLSWAVLPFLAFYYLGDFSATLSAALALILWLLFARTQQIWEYLAVQERFEPFWVHVDPKWDELLRDYNLVESGEQLDQLFARARAQPDGYKVLLAGFMFTVLRPTPGWVDFRGLLYSNRYNSFVSEVDFLERVEGSPLRAEINDETPILGNYLSAFVKWGTDGGFDLGLVVENDWWSRFCETTSNKALTQIRTDADHLCGTVRLKIATLPYQEFRMYAGSLEEYTMQRAEREEQEREKILAKFGWKRQEEADAETRYVFDPPNQIEHKYFTVTHRAI